MNRIHRCGSKVAGATLTFGISKGGAVTESDAFKILMTRPYWSRAWIVQEMMSARSLVIQCGSYVVPYSILEKAHPRDKPACFQFRSGEDPATRLHFRGDSEVAILRMGSERLYPKRYLDCFLDRQCRMRHDNIFAFLNLLTGDIQRRVRVDYDRDCREVVLDMAKAIIESTQSLHIIIIKGRQTPPSALGEDGWQLQMPSWCPYLAMPYRCRPIEPQRMPSFFAEKASPSFGNGSLRAKGFVIGKVTYTVLRQTCLDNPRKTWWDKADIRRERNHYLRCLELGMIGMPQSVHNVLQSLESTSCTLLAGQDQEFDVQYLLNIVMNKLGDDEALALRKVRNLGASRSVCSFKLNRAVAKTLVYGKTAPVARINRIALAPRAVRTGDYLCAILGCATPVVLRKIGTRYHVLGEAYSDMHAMGTFKVTVKLRDFLLD